MNRIAGVEEFAFRGAWRDWASRRNVIAAGSYLVLYVVLDWLSYVQPVLKLGITPWNPQAGLTLAYLLVFGPRWLSVTALSALVSEVLVRNNAATSPLVLASSACIAVGYGVLAAILRRHNLADPIRTPSVAAWFAGASAVVSLIVAILYVSLVTAAGTLPRTDANGSIAQYWVGDLNGILSLTPLLMYARSWREGVRAARARPWEILAQIGAVLLTLWVIFGVAVMDELRVFYLLFLPLIWIALRWGLVGAMLATLAIQVALVIVARDESRAPPLIDLQFLMVTLSLTALLLGAVVAERAAVLRRMARSEAEQRALLAVAPDAVLAVDSVGQVRIANPAAIKLFGDNAAAHHGSFLKSLLPGLALDAPEGRVSLEGRRPDGSGFPAEIAWARLDTPENDGFLVTVRDATDRRRAEEQLRERDTTLARAMRFAVAGELASALAHELNQPITALVSYLRASEILVAPFGAQDARINATLGKAAQEAIRASEVLRRLRDFYRGGALKRETVHIPALCLAVSTSFQERLRRANVSLVIRVDEGVPGIQGDSIQIEVVLQNLVTNAIDAVTQVAESRRRIELTARVSQNSILLRVEDSGPGIAPDVSARLFEPFTTSKPDGMGLGLAISRSLIRARGGDLSLGPKGKLGGAAFEVRLPIQIPQDSLP